MIRTHGTTSYWPPTLKGESLHSVTSKDVEGDVFMHWTFHLVTGCV